MVDYGGGTLDIALCDVKGNGESSYVKAIARSGAGWNSERQLGKAGLAFIEEIVKIALLAGGIEEERLFQDDKFYKCTYSVEQALMLKVDEIEDIFKENILSDIEKIEDEFYTVDFHDEEYTVTYGMLAQAYNVVIRDLLNKTLNDIIEEMKKNNIAYDASQQNFKIALVGGFCNFYLTKKQIEEKFDKAVNDARFRDIINTVSDNEKAITYGTALIANGVIGFKQIAPYSLGFAAREVEKKDYQWAIKKGDDVEFGKVRMFQLNGEDRIFQGTHIPLIAFNFEEKLEFAQAKEPLAKYRNQLHLEPGKYYKFGLSLDRSMIITLHKWVVPNIERKDKVEGEEKVILNDLFNLFGGIIQI